MSSASLELAGLTTWRLGTRPVGAISLVMSPCLASYQGHHVTLRIHCIAESNARFKECTGKGLTCKVRGQSRGSHPDPMTAVVRIAPVIARIHRPNRGDSGH